MQRVPGTVVESAETREPGFARGDVKEPRPALVHDAAVVGGGVLVVCNLEGVGFSGGRWFWQDHPGVVVQVAGFLEESQLLALGVQDRRNPEDATQAERQHARRASRHLEIHVGRRGKAIVLPDLGVNIFLAAMRQQGAVLRPSRVRVLLRPVKTRPPFEVLVAVVMDQHDFFIVSEVRQQQRIAVPTDLIKQVAVVVALEIRQEESFARRIRQVSQHARREVAHHQVSLLLVFPPVVKTLFVFLLGGLKGMRRCLGAGARTNLYELL